MSNQSPQGMASGAFLIWLAGIMNLLNHVQGGKMASYVDNSLIKEEAILYRGTLSLWALSGYLAVGVLLVPESGSLSCWQP